MVCSWFTECSQTGNENTPRQFLNDFMDNLNGLYFGNLGNWGRTVLHWTMAVDLKLGPHSGGCATCSGIVTVDATNNSIPYTVKVPPTPSTLSTPPLPLPTLSHLCFPLALCLCCDSTTTSITPSGTSVH